MAPGSLVLAVDKIPGDLLYRTGLKGFRVEPPLSEKELVKWAHLGARYLIVPAVEKLMPTVIGRHVGNQAWVADGVAIYRLDVAPIRLSMP